MGCWVLICVDMSGYWMFEVSDLSFGGASISVFVAVKAEMNLIISPWGKLHFHLSNVLDI